MYILPYPANLPTIKTYYKKLQQVLEQLIRNAISYSDKEKVIIEITAEEDPDFIKLAVSDNGPGISPINKDKIFTLFYTARSKDIHEAIGAGLTIAKKTAEFAGGTLELKRAVNACTFLISWPKNLNLNN